MKVLRKILAAPFLWIGAISYWCYIRIAPTEVNPFVSKGVKKLDPSTSEKA